ncbi:MAG: hypothetical protein NZ959_11415 [Armatimonadetes bacterium]|nr:hypothetical protein [Armatimonadota bacterium]MDW8122930.1 hypothetical protein [Armatimonadota bacterium]
MRFLLPFLSFLSLPVSDTKLGIHLIGSFSEGARKIVVEGPPVIKVLDPQAIGPMREAMALYKKMFPNGVVVARIWEGTPRLRFQLSDDSEESANQFWHTVLQPALLRLSPEERQLIDFLEGPNEGENCPTWESVESARWFGRFWVRLSRRISQFSLRPCVGSIAVGNPPGTIEEIQAKLTAFAPALQTALECNGTWSYHAYSLEYTTDPSVERWYSLRYRLFYECLSKTNPKLTKLPIILTEGGIDRAGNPQTDGWRARGDVNTFQRWLEWFDQELKKDRQVIGVTLFQIGDPHGWTSFDLEPIAEWLAGYIRKNRRS